MTAAYRFFDNDKVEFENVLQPHMDANYSESQVRTSRSWCKTLPNWIYTT